MTEVKLVYFAWVRERVGVPEERVALPESLQTVRDVADWLAGRGEQYAAAFGNPESVRAAIDHRHVKPETEIAGASEIAFFPPMTGG